MANSYTTLLDIAKANGSDATTGLIDETINAHPEIKVGSARTIKGQSYKTLVRTSLPTTSFRNANQGSATVKSTYENRLVETFILNPRWVCDKAIADRYEDGPEAYIGMEANALIAGSMVRLASQFYYGQSSLAAVTGANGLALGDSAGFPGLMAAYDSTNMVVNAGGTSAGTGSSVWAVKFGPDMVQCVYGENGTLDISPLWTFPYTDPNDSTKQFTAYIQELLAYPGLQIGNLRTIGRIYNLTADAGCTLTDAKLFSLLALFPVGYRPDAVFMSRRSLNQLRQSRTAVNVTGAPAPIPTEVEGIPIFPTDAISNVETLNSL